MQWRFAIAEDPKYRGYVKHKSSDSNVCSIVWVR